MAEKGVPSAQQLNGDVDVQQGSSRATANADQYQENVDKVDKLMAEGHGFMLAQSFEEAMTRFYDALELSTKNFGDFSHQSFAPYFNYGKALIEVARLETLPIKTPADLEELDEEESENDQYQREEEASKEAKKPQEVMTNGQADKKLENVEPTDIEDVATGKTQQQKSEEVVKNNGTSETNKEKTGGEFKVEQMEQKMPHQVDEVSDKESDGSGPENEEANDVEDVGDDIQIAWENLEIARKICEKQSENPSLWLERKADVLVALGDCMCVGGNFTSAMDDFTSALEIREKLFESTDRRIAEVHFWIARTHKLMDNFQAAAEAFENAKQVLSSLIGAKEKETNSDELVAELKEVVQGVEEQIQDAIDSAEQHSKGMMELKAIMQPMVHQLLSASQQGSETDEAQDITAMLKRKPVKRPLGVAENAEDQTVVKVAKHDDTNGLKADSEAGDKVSGDGGIEVTTTNGHIVVGDDQPAVGNAQQPEHKLAAKILMDVADGNKEATTVEETAKL